MTESNYSTACKWDSALGQCFDFARGSNMQNRLCKNKNVEFAFIWYSNTKVPQDLSFLFIARITREFKRIFLRRI